MDTKTQREQLLESLKRSSNGVNSYFATYSMKIKQAPTRVRELKELGYNIISKHNKDRSVNWILSDTLIEKPKESKGHWDFSTGVAKWVNGEVQVIKPVQEALI